MLVRIPTFNGIVPRTSPRLLQDTFAQTAVDTKLWNGTLRAWRESVKVADLPRAGIKQTVYRFGQDHADDTAFWFHWTQQVNVVRSPVAGNERTFFSGDGAPKVTDSVLALTGGGAYPNAAYDLGVPSPTQAPTAVVTGAPDPDEQVTSRFYVYTFVNEWGEEGSHSPVSAQVDARASQTITLSNMEVPTGAQSYSAKRIYETAGTGAAASFFFKTQVAAGTDSVSFLGSTAAVPNPDGTFGVGSLMKTAGWTPPPADLRGMRIMAGQILYGLSGNKLRMAEPGFPYAWPTNYSFAFEFDPVAAGSYGNTIVVATKGTPYIIAGYEPATMQQTKIERQYACVSARSLVEIGGGVAYASPDGMIVVDQGGATNITAGYYDADQWKALKPESMHAYWWDNRIVLFYDTGTKQGGLIFAPGAEPTELGWYTTGAYVDPLRDNLYVIVGNELHRFDSGTPRTFQWRSKIFSTGRPLNFGAAQVRCEGSVIARFYADGTLRHTQPIANREPFRLPGGFLADEWEIGLEGTGEVFSVAFAERMAELKDA